MAKRMRWLFGVLAFVAASAALGVTPNGFSIPYQNTTFSSMVRNMPTYVDVAVLSANTKQTFTLPTNTNWVIFSQSSGCDFWFTEGSTISVPGASVTDGTGYILNPAAIHLDSGTASISLISAGTCSVSMEMYQ